MNPKSVSGNAEYATVIYGEPGSYKYAEPWTDNSQEHVHLAKDIALIVADVHTHSAYNPNYASDWFSQVDIDNANSRKNVAILGTPGGSIMIYDPKNRDHVKSPFNNFMKNPHKKGPLSSPFAKCDTKK